VRCLTLVDHDERVRARRVDLDGGRVDGELGRGDVDRPPPDARSASGASSAPPPPAASSAAARAVPAVVSIEHRMCGHVTSRSASRSCWPACGCASAVDVYVGYLRKKLGRERITSIRRMGYRLERGRGS
jgi:hypothetical protein